MPKLLWFVFGFAGGMAYASRQIHKSHLNLAPGQQAVENLGNQQQDVRQRIADRLDEQVHRLSDLVCEQGHMLVDRIRGGEIQSRQHHHYHGPVPTYGDVDLAEPTITPVNVGLETQR